MSEVKDERCNMKNVLLKPILLALIALTCALAACSAAPPVASPATSEDNAYFYDESTGRVYTDISDNFDFKVERWKYFYDEEAKQDRILFSVLIKCKTDEAKKNFV